MRTKMEKERKREWLECLMVTLRLMGLGPWMNLDLGLGKARSDCWDLEPLAAF